MRSFVSYRGSLRNSGGEGMVELYIVIQVSMGLKRDIKWGYVGFESEIDEEVDEEDIGLDEFKDEIDGWVIDELKKLGLTTARQVLGTSREELAQKADLEEETIDEVIRVLSAEFEK